MSGSNPVDVVGAVFNHLRDDSYGRVGFVCRQFNLSRSDFYRKKNDFNMLFGSSGRPPVDARKLEDRRLKDELRSALEENEALKAQLRKEHSLREASMRKVRFLLIATGLSSRTIAWVIRLSFGMKANHTDIAKLAQAYAAKATLIMGECFHTCARTVAIDEVFVEGRPIFVAVAPRSLLICNCAVRDRRTEKEWTAFLDEMENLKSTVSDRGQGILAAISKRDGHIHYSDIFHCMFTVNKELRKMEAHCYRLIREEDEARLKLQKRKTSGRNACMAAANLRKATERCTDALERFDHLEQAVRLAFEALNLSFGIRLNSCVEARETLDFVCEWITQIHPSWKKVVAALKDPGLLTHLEQVYRRFEDLHIQGSPIDREYVLASLTFFWEQQALRRWRGKPVVLPQSVMASLKRSCTNFDQVCAELFEILEDVPKASSAVECINSRIGFFRYSKKRFSNDFANFICVIHNLTPFLDGKRKGKSPVELEGLKLPTTDLFELFDVI
jgi:hypothetical protein